MKKSLIALAVMAASGAAMAQSSVSVYGLVDIWVGSTKDAGVSNSVVDSGGFNTSRIGFKGTEDLGGGLKANFVIETAVAPDAPGRTSLGDRNAWVGLAGGFGEVQAGRVWTPYDDTRAMANDTFNANIASSFLVWEGYTDRTTNGIRYNTPTFGGFTGSFAYAFGEDKSATQTSASSITSLSLNYANGPIVAGLAYQQEKDNNPQLFTTDPVTGAVLTTGGIFAGGIGGVSTNKRTYTLINGSYDLGVAKLIAGYNTVKLTAPELASPIKANEFNIGVDAPLGANLAVGAGYSQSKVKQAGVEQSKTTGYTVALKYALSKRTFSYAAVAQAKTKTPGAADDKFRLFAVGLQHAF